MASYRDLPCSIEDLINLLRIEVVKDNGSKLICKCPFCDDRRGHFDVDLKDNVFHCYRCGQGGGVLHLYALYRDIPLNVAGDELTRYFKSDEGIDLHQRQPKRKLAVKTEEPIASVSERDNTYSNLLSLLKLCDAHREALGRRGMTETDIAWSGYRTTPAVRLPKLVKELQARGCTLQGVPGFYMDQGTNEWKLDIRGHGIMLPDRNSEGEIEAIQIRLDENKRGHKFNNLTSADRYMGTTANCCPHFVGVQQGAKSAMITEGVMKADIAHRFSKALNQPRGVVGLTGAGMKNQYRRALQELKTLGVERILLAYDMDYHTNDAVAQNRLFAIETGMAEGFEVVPMEWSTEYKGIDDLLLSFLQRQKQTE